MFLPHASEILTKAYVVHTRNLELFTPGFDKKQSRGLAEWGQEEEQENEQH